MKSNLCPAGFVKLQFPAQVWWVKAGWEQFVMAAFLSTQAPLATASTLTPIGGRGVLYRLPLKDGGSAVIRHYRRGGLMRHFTQDLYWGRPLRPFAELICTEIARQRQVPTIEVLAAGVEYRALGSYRGLFVSREAENFINLWEWIRSFPPSHERRQVIENVAHLVAHLHAVGVYHPDLNLTNILILPHTPQPQSLIIDFDRARVLTGLLSQSQRKRNLQRLRRSLYKLDPSTQFSSPVDLEIFCQAYHTQLSSLRSSLL